jgi:DNA adenine methylase
MLKAPFPYFGGKSKIAHTVWQALGDVDHYIEPFFGSGAVLLARPNYNPLKHTETVNDFDCNVANAWRALKSAPDEVAEWCDWPVNHADLCARRIRIIESMDTLRENVIANDSYCDPKLAGYWIWGMGTWIGSGLTSKTVIPHLADKGRGVHGIGKIPHLGNKGIGVIKQSQNVYDWFAKLSERLRRVRVVCGDWSQVCGGNWQASRGGWNKCGMFFDPPYGVEDRDTSVYYHDSLTVALEAAKWAVERGKDPAYRIVFAGYTEEHGILDEAGWTRKAWSTSGGYGKTARSGEKTLGQLNAKRECLWFSPHCIKSQNTLFEGV